MTGENVCSNCGSDFGMYEVEECCCGNCCADNCECMDGCEYCFFTCSDYEVDEDEPDGQPDEAQEWADYDPDC